MAKIIVNKAKNIIETGPKKTFIKLKNTGGPRGIQGVKGDKGDAATVSVGTTTTLPAGSSATVSNSGSTSDAVFNFGIPKGDKGDKGDTGSTGPAATIVVGSTTTGYPGSNASVTNSGTSSAAVFNFTIPRGNKGDKGDKGDTGAAGAAGAAATIAAGSVTTLPAGSSATVTNSGTSSAAVFNFGIPKGDKGDKGDPGAGLVITGTVATYADLPSNLGPSDAGKAYFVQADGKLYVWTGTAWPADGQGSQFEGPQGPAGQDGAAATVTVGTTTTLPAGSSATVTNTGTTSAAVLNFGIPKGDTGSGGTSRYDMSWALISQTATQTQYDELVEAINNGDVIYINDSADDIIAYKYGVGQHNINVWFSGGNFATTSPSVVTLDTLWVAIDNTTRAITLYLDTPTVATKTSQLTNDGSDGTSTYVEADDLATVATSGSYSDLTGTPSLATVATTGLYSDLSGTPSLAAVATSGSYTDLSNKPTIPTVNDATLTIQKNGTNVTTFTANASSNVTANITVPTAVTDLSDASNYVTTSDIADVIRTTDVGVIRGQNIANDEITSSKIDWTTMPRLVATALSGSVAWTNNTFINLGFNGTKTILDSNYASVSGEDILLQPGNYMIVARIRFTDVGSGSNFFFGIRLEGESSDDGIEKGGWTYSGQRASSEATRILQLNSATKFRLQAWTQNGGGCSSAVAWVIRLPSTS